MIVFRLGKWTSSSQVFFVYERIYINGMWTPFCKIRKRYKSWFGYFHKPQPRSMYIKPLPTLWFENERGEKYIPTIDEIKEVKMPEGYNYLHSQFPTRLSHSILKLINQKDVDSCNHPSAKIRPTDGWVDDVEGRKCLKCGGTQVKKKDEKWSETKWNGNRSDEISRGDSGWSPDLVLAMTNSGDYELPDAILIAANSCSRCMNALAYQYGLDWGFQVGSEEWVKTGTSCQFCEFEVPEHQVQ